MTDAPLGWIGIVRLGLVQTSLGAVVVLTTSTMNRVMIVELALPAILPGILVGLHYAVQILRPRWGYGSDIGGRRTPWIIGGMAVLALGGVGAAAATAWMETNTTAGIALALAAFMTIGVGVGAAGTSLLALLAGRVDPGRRPAAATIVWIMMIAGFVVTAATAGHFLDPFSPARLVAVTGGVAACAFVLAVAAVWGLEGASRRTPAASAAVSAKIRARSFRQALGEVWGERQSRRFAVFVFVSMLAYSAQDLVLEPFAGAIFGLTPGETTQLGGLQYAGVLTGMLLVAVVGTLAKGTRFASLRGWTVGGCIASALSLLALAAAGPVGPDWPLRPTVFVLGVSIGAFAVAAIGSMMALAGSGRPAREGTRMGVWGAAQAMAFGLGGLLAAAGIDLVRHLLGSPVAAYAIVFVAQGGMFLVAGWMASRVGRSTAERSVSLADGGRGMLAEGGA